jgi:hypothetical protein
VSDETLNRDQALTDLEHVAPLEQASARLCAELGVPHAYAIGRDEPIRVLEQWGVVKRAAA